MKKTPHEIDVYVRFSETDAMGHVNNTSYFLYLEEARTKFFSTVHPKRTRSIGFILASIKCDYINQAFANEQLKVYTSVKRVGDKSFTLQQTIRSEDGNTIIANAEAVTVCFNYQDQKTISIPEDLRLALVEYLTTPLNPKVCK